MFDAVAPGFTGEEKLIFNKNTLVGGFLHLTGAAAAQSKSLQSKTFTANVNV